MRFPPFARRFARALFAVVLVLACAWSAATPGSAQSPSNPQPAGTTAAAPLAGGAGPATQQGPQAVPGTQGPGISVNLSSGTNGPARLNTSLEIVLFMTMLTLAPAIVMTMTCFPRIIIVLSFLRRAISVQELPPTMIVTGFAVFLTIFIMMPVVDDIYAHAYQPYIAEQIAFEQAASIAGERMNRFMLSQTREEDIALVLELSRSAQPNTPADVPFHVVVPAFILSEIKTAFQMGFVLFLPFVAIDLVISSILISMGMFTLPPVVVSTPLKLLLFIMVDGWNLVVGSLAESFVNA